MPAQRMETPITVAEAILAIQKAEFEKFFDERRALLLQRLKTALG